MILPGPACYNLFVGVSQTHRKVGLEEPKSVSNACSCLEA